MIAVKVHARFPSAQDRPGPRRNQPPAGPFDTTMRRALAIVLVLACLLAGTPGSIRAAPPAQPASPPLAIRGEHFVDLGEQPVFVLGANYEGPADRAWQMWDDERFDPTLIAEDFSRAGAASLLVLRVFVQRSLADDVRAERWAKLDRVLDLADRYGLKRVLTFADYGELNLARLATIDQLVAARYRGRATIFAYDLKNEPRLWDLALADYGPGLAVPLQDPALVSALGELVARHDVAEYRGSDPGQREIPRHLTDDQAWVYANVLVAYRGFLQDAQAWARDRDATVVGYLHAPESAAWRPLVEALDNTLAAWLAPRLTALRASDPGRPVTVGQVDPIIASLPANAWLDYRALHLYPAGSSDAIVASMAVFDDVRSAVSGTPLILGEFGFSNATLDEERSAALEAEMARSVCTRGGAGALKWMLNDFPAGHNPRENAFGMYRGDGSAKPVVAAFGGLAELRPVVWPWRAGDPRPADYDVCGGRFFTQAVTADAGPGPVLGEPHPAGYSVTNLDGIAFWDAFRQLGGVRDLGYPIGRRFMRDGFVVQPMQKGMLRWRPSQQRAERIDGNPGPIPEYATVPEPAP